MTVKQALRVLDPINPVGFSELVEIYKEAELAEGITLLDVTESCLREAYGIVQKVVKMYCNEHDMCE